MCDLENIDQLPIALEVPQSLAGVAFVRAPKVADKNYPLLVLYAEHIGIGRRTWCLRVTAEEGTTRVPIGSYPPVVPSEGSGAVPKRGGVDAYINFDEPDLAARKILGDRQWCGSLTNSAGADRLREKLRRSSVLDTQLSDLSRFVLRRRLGT